MGSFAVILVVILVVTNLAALAALARVVRVRAGTGDDTVETFEAPRPAGVTTRDRRLLTVEILNPIELATARGGRVAGLAGSIAPGFTRRLVYDQTLRTLRRELADKNVLADVRVHTLRSVPRTSVARPDSAVIDAVVVDEVAPLDLREGT